MSSPPKPAQPPTRVEIERKLSMKLVSPPESRRARKLSSPSLPSGSLTSKPPVAYYPSPSGNDSDSSTHSQPLSTGPSPHLPTTSSPILAPSSVSGGVLSAIAETGLAEGDAFSEGDLEMEGEGEEGDEGSEEGEMEGDGGELRKGMEGERVLKSGYLMKKGERRKSWKKRWFVLRNEKLAYYKDHKEYVICRILHLKEIHSVVPVQLKKHQNVFGIVTPKRTYYVQASNKSDMDSWMESLNDTKNRWLEDKLAKKGVISSPQAGSVPDGLRLPPPLSSPSIAQTYAPNAIPISQSNTATSLETPMTRLGLGVSPPPAPSAASQQRSRQIASRNTSATREPSASSLSSSGGGAGAGTYGQQQQAGDISVADTTMQSDMAGVTSSDDEDLYGPTVASIQPSAGPSQPQKVQFQAPLIQTDPKKVILSGYLMKMGMQRKNWKKRWFVLTSGALMYTKSHMDTKVHRQIPLSQVLDAIEINGGVDVESEGDESDGAQDDNRAYPRRGRGKEGRDRFKKVQHAFQVITPKRTFRLCAPSEEDEIKWLAALRALVNRERGAMSPVTTVPPTTARTTDPSPALASHSSAAGSYFPQPTLDQENNKRHTDLPPLVTSMSRNRSATQSALSAVAHVVERFQQDAKT